MHVLELTDVPLDATYTANGSRFAVALQDSTIKIYYSDTYKFVLSLYGHKLPVNSISISSDSQLLVCIIWNFMLPTILSLQF